MEIRIIMQAKVTTPLFQAIWKKEIECLGKEIGTEVRIFHLDKYKSSLKEVVSPSTRQIKTTILQSLKSAISLSQGKVLQAQSPVQHLVSSIKTKTNSRDQEALMKWLKTIRHYLTKPQSLTKIRMHKINKLSNLSLTPMTQANNQWIWSKNWPHPLS